MAHIANRTLAINAIIATWLSSSSWKKFVTIKHVRNFMPLTGELFTIREKLFHFFCQTYVFSS